MDTFRFPKFADDVSIFGIGSFFRRIDGNRWWINLALYPKQEKPFLTLSNAPVISRRQILNPTQNGTPRGWHEHFRIANTASWEIAQIKDCPINGFSNKPDSEQFCFTFTTASGLRVFLPQYELARALFFHNKYLAKASIEPSCLQADFDITHDNRSNTTRINVLPTSDLPAQYLNDAGYRKMLAWILLDSDARRSFESIGINQKIQGRESKNYRHWDFQFTPPQLTNCQISVRGHYENDAHCIFVYSIARLTDIHANTPKTIEFFHPELNSGASGQTGSATTRGREEYDDFEIDDETETNTDAKPIILLPQPVEIAFDRPIYTKRSGNKSATAGATLEKDGQSPSNNRLGTEVGTAGAGLPAADWNILKDMSDDTDLFVNKFSCFLEMLKILTHHHHCTIVSKEIRKLPKIPRCSKHLLATDGTPRNIAVVGLRCNGKLFYLLEVDTSDGEKSLSTLLLFNDSSQPLDNYIKQLEYRLLKSSLNWPRKFLLRICGANGFFGISHPKTKATNKGLLAPDSIISWANRISNQIK